MEKKYTISVLYEGNDKPIIYRNITGYKYSIEEGWMALIYPVKKKEKTVYILLGKVLNFSIEEMDV